MSLGAFVLLGPVIQPWYLLWAALPLAAATARSRGIAGPPSGSPSLFSVIIMPNGATIPTFAIVQAVLVAGIAAIGVLLGLRRPVFR